MLNYWMFKCRDITNLISISMDIELSLWERMGIKIHLMMCHLCRKYKMQLELIREAISKIEADNETDLFNIPLPDRVKKRIQDHLMEL